MQVLGRVKAHYRDSGVVSRRMANRALTGVDVVIWEEQTEGEGEDMNEMGDQLLQPLLTNTGFIVVEFALCLNNYYRSLVNHMVEVSVV